MIASTCYKPTVGATVFIRSTAFQLARQKFLIWFLTADVFQQPLFIVSQLSWTTCTISNIALFDVFSLFVLACLTSFGTKVFLVVDFQLVIQINLSPKGVATSLIAFIPPIVILDCWLPLTSRFWMGTVTKFSITPFLLSVTLIDLGLLFCVAASSGLYVPSCIFNIFVSKYWWIFTTTHCVRTVDIKKVLTNGFFQTWFSSLKQLQPFYLDFDAWHWRFCCNHSQLSVHIISTYGRRTTVNFDVARTFSQYFLILRRFYRLCLHHFHHGLNLTVLLMNNQHRNFHTFTISKWNCFFIKQQCDAISFIM